MGERITAAGYDFEIPTPSKRMLEIGEKQGWHFYDKPCDIFGAVEILSNRQMTKDS